MKRAMFNYTVATNYYITKLQKKQEERLQKMIQEEEIRMLRKEMVPKAQLMPFFDRPFLPQRSSRPLTMPKEPSFGNVNSTCWTCVFNNQHYLYHIHHAHA
uniref:TPX2 C-terminal domain-containing protein n=1 Tax=Brassica campestris TaxID=3711 RepID=M4E9I7_BRACM